MSYFKERHKEYLIKNEIKTEDELVIYLDILRNTRNSPKEDRQMLMDFAWLMINEKSSVSSFFAENKNPSKEFYNTFKNLVENEDRYDRVRGNFHRKLLAPTIEVCEFNSIEDAKKYFNSTDYTEAFYYTYGTNELIEKEEKSGNSPTFMDEVLDSNITTTEVPNFNITGIKQILPKHVFDTIEKQEGKRPDTFNCRPKVVSESGEKLTFDENFNLQEVGKKEKEGKLHYELSWEFIEEMAKRMANNKSDKYPLYNWKKDINVQDLKDAINRHHIEVMKGNYKDGDEILGHIVQYACNSMMLWEQLRSKS